MQYVMCGPNIKHSKATSCVCGHFFLVPADSQKSQYPTAEQVFGHLHRAP